MPQKSIRQALNEARAKLATISLSPPAGRGDEAEM